MSCKQLESLIGKLQFTSQVIRAGHIFLGHLLDKLRGSPKWGYISVPVHIMQDVMWWQYIKPANSFFFFLCKMLFAGSVVPRCALVWGMVVRGFAHQDLC